MAKRRQYLELPDVELDEKIRTMTEVADRDIEEARVSFRWGRGAWGLRALAVADRR